MQQKNGNEKIEGFPLAKKKLKMFFLSMKHCSVVLKSTEKYWGLYKFEIVLLNDLKVGRQSTQIPLNKLVKNQWKHPNCSSQSWDHKSQSYQSLFFFVSVVKLECLLHLVKNEFSIKGPRLTAKMEQFFVSGENQFDLRGLAPS